MIEREPTPGLRGLAVIEAFGQGIRKWVASSYYQLIMNDLVKTLHPYAAGKVYAAYGGVYVAVAVVWLWLVDGIKPDRWDVTGSLIALVGMAVILFAPRASA